jgi:hypothetical protein
MGRSHRNGTVASNPVARGVFFISSDRLSGPPHDIYIYIYIYIDATSRDSSRRWYLLQRPSIHWHVLSPATKYGRCLLGIYRSQGEASPDFVRVFYHV